MVLRHATTLNVHLEFLSGGREDGYYWGLLWEIHP